MIEELCLAGSVQRGISYIGSLKKFEDMSLLNRKSLKKCVGTSIGSFILTCYIIGYSINEMLTLTMESNLNNFIDISLNNNKNAIANGNVFRQWVYDSLLLKINPEITLLELYNITGVHLIITSTSIEDGLVHIDHINNPDMILYKALIASMNIPLIYSPYEINNKNYVDGGLLDNFPLYILGPKAVGIRTISNKNYNINDPFSLLDRLNSLCYEHLSSFKKPSSKYIVEIDTSDFSKIDFSINKHDKITLYMRGYNSVSEELFKDYNILMIDQ